MSSAAERDTTPPRTDAPDQPGHAGLARVDDQHSEPAGTHHRARAGIWRAWMCFAIGLLLGRWAPDPRLDGLSAGILPQPLIDALGWIGPGWLSVGSGVLAGALVGAGVGARVVRGRRRPWAPGDGGRAWSGKGGRRAGVSALAAIGLLGFGWASFRLHTDPPGALWDELGHRSAGAGRVLAEAEFVVVAPPEPVEASDAHLGLRQRPSTWWFHADLLRVRTDNGERRVRGRVRVFVPAPGAGDDDADRVGDALPEIGERVRATGWLSPMSNPMNPGEHDWRLWGRQSGKAGDLNLGGPDALTRVAAPSGLVERLVSSPRAVRDALRRRAVEVADTIARDDRVRAVYLPVLLGERDPRPAPDAVTDAVPNADPHIVSGVTTVPVAPSTALREATQQTGTAHFLAISGLHIALLGAMLVALVRLTGDRGWVEPAIVLAGVVFIMLIVPSKPPVVRASLLLGAFVIASACGRRYDSLTVLGWIAIGLLVWRPLDITNMGYQLTVGASALLIRLNEQRVDPLGTPYGWLPERGSLRAFGAWLWPIVRGCAMCSVGTTPILATHYGLISPLSMFATLVLSPLFVPMLGVGYLALLLGMIHPALGEAVAPPARVLAEWYYSINLSLTHVPWMSFRIPPPPVAWGVISTGVFVWWVCRPWRWRTRRSRLALAVAGLGVVAWLAAHLLVSARQPEGVLARVDMLSVGDGTCVLVRAGDESMLWDAGSLSPSAASEEITRHLIALGVSEIDTVVLTHPNADHVNAMPTIVRNIPVGRVVTSDTFLTGAHQPGVRAALGTLRAAVVPISATSRGGRLDLPGLSGEVLWPPAHWGTDDRGRVVEANDTSLVVRFTDAQTGEALLLLTGDIQRAAMVRLMDDDLGARVLELPHHGSVHPAAGAFVAQVDPAVVLQSTGIRRAGDDRWDPWRPGRVWATTATDGAATVWLFQNGRIRVRTFGDGAVTEVGRDRGPG